MRLETESGLTSAGPAGQAWDLGLYVKCSGKPLEGFEEELENDTRFILWKDQNGYRVETGWLGEGRGGYSEDAVGIALCRQRLWRSLGGDIMVEMWGGG